MTTDTDDDRLLIEAAQGNPARFGELYERYVDRVYAFVIRRTRDRAAAEDITSGVFEHALAHLNRFEWRGIPFFAWLCRIASNAITDRYRQSARDWQELPTDIPDTHEMDGIERRIMLFQLVERLPDAQRQVIQMRFGEDKGIAEIAAALDRSQGAVKQLQLRALENLRKGMGSP